MIPGGGFRGSLIRDLFFLNYSVGAWDRSRIKTQSFSSLKLVPKLESLILSHAKILLSFFAVNEQVVSVFNFSFETSVSKTQNALFSSSIATCTPIFPESSNLNCVLAQDTNKIVIASINIILFIVTSLNLGSFH